MLFVACVHACVCMFFLCVRAHIFLRACVRVFFACMRIICVRLGARFFVHVCVRACAVRKSVAARNAHLARRVIYYASAFHFRISQCCISQFAFRIVRVAAHSAFRSSHVAWSMSQFFALHISHSAVRTMQFECRISQFALRTSWFALRISQIAVRISQRARERASWTPTY